MVNATLRHLIYDYDAAKAAMGEAAANLSVDPATFQQIVQDCATIRNQIEDLMPKDFCDPMANNRVEYIK